MVVDARVVRHWDYRKMVVEVLVVVLEVVLDLVGYYVGSRMHQVECNVVPKRCSKSGMECFATGVDSGVVNRTDAAR